MLLHVHFGSCSITLKIQTLSFFSHKGNWRRQPASNGWMQRQCVAAAGIRHVTLGRIHLQGRPLVSGREEGEDSQVHEEEERKKLQQEDQGKLKRSHFMSSWGTDSSWRKAFAVCMSENFSRQPTSSPGKVCEEWRARRGGKTELQQPWIRRRRRSKLSACLSRYHSYGELLQISATLLVQAVVKEEDILDSSDILAHISGVNSFKYNYTLESWIWLERPKQGEFIIHPINSMVWRMLLLRRVLPHILPYLHVSTSKNYPRSFTC